MATDKKLTAANKTDIDPVSRALLEIVWQFGPKGLDGECCEDLSMPEYFALEAASLTPDCPVQHIGKELGFTKSGATRIVNRLEKKGYIKKLPSSEDGRICCVVPTPKGTQTLTDVSRYFQDKLNAVLKQTPEGQPETIKEAIVTMAKAVRS